MYRTGW